MNTKTTSSEANKTRIKNNQRRRREATQPATNLTDDDYRMLESSWITRDIADAAGIFRVTNTEGRALFGYDRNHAGDYAGLVFPYTIPGETTPCEHRLRRDNADLVLEDNIHKEKRKCVWPQARRNRLYFVRGTDPALLQDSLPIVIAEGEKKTLALYRLAGWNSDKPRFLPIGLGGVWSWRGTVGNEPSATGKRTPVKGALPDFDLISWAENRTVIIIFDSDVASNSSVQVARLELAKELKSRGAVVKLVDLPNLPGFDKTGADDFLASPDGGPERMLELIENATPAGKNAGDAPVIETTVELKSAAEYEIKPVQWLWPGYLALGKLHVLCGRPGCGKTTIAIKLAASVTTGLGWPNGVHISEPGNVVIWSGEDDVADTLLTRLTAAGAKIDRIYFVNGVTDIEGKRAFDPSVDMEPLHRAIRKTDDVKLLIVDPLVSAVSGDDHKNNVVRRALQPLADLAAALNIAVLGISHFTKNSDGKHPTDRLIGSLAYGAAARIVLVAAKNEDDGTRIFCRAKSNIGSDDGGFEYELKQEALPDNPEIIASRVIWGAPLTGAARDLLAQAEATNTRKDSALAEAKEFLLEILRGSKDGSVEAKDIKRLAGDAGISTATLRRAREVLEIKITHVGLRGKGGKTLWSLHSKLDIPDATNETTDSRKCSKNPVNAQQNLWALTENDEHQREIDPASIDPKKQNSYDDFVEVTI